MFQQSAECWNDWVKIIFLPLCSIWSVDKETFFHQNISKLVERGDTESNSGSLHLDMYIVIPFPPQNVFYPSCCINRNNAFDIYQLKMTISPLLEFLPF